MAVRSIMGAEMVKERVELQQQQTHISNLLLSPYVGARDIAAVYSLCLTEARIYGTNGGRVLALDNAGVVLADSHSLLNGTLLAHKEVLDIVNATETPSGSYGFHKVDGEWLAYYTSPMWYQSEQVGILLVSVSVQDLDDTISGAITRFTLAMMLVLVLIIIFSIYLARWVSEPISRMTSVIREVSTTGRMDLRVDESGATEMAEMGKAFNLMSARLENLDQVRNEFVANASHELKTPLSAIKILAESLLYQENVEEETYREFLIDINSQIDRLSGLLNDLMELTQIDQMDYVINYDHLMLNEMIRESVMAVLPMAEEKNITVEAEADHAEIEVDPVKMSTALTNVIGNAIKYTPEGGHVYIDGSMRGGIIYIAVTDDGMGIPEEDLPHVFERFYRVDKARSRATGGTGLGLSIVSRILHLHHGEITVESVEDEGSTFTLVFPQRGKDT